jgi:hypothetical protein
VLFLLLTPLAGLLMLRTAPVQTLLAHRAAAILSRQLNTEVQVGSFRLNWFLDAILTDIKILDRHRNILLKAGKIRANVGFIDSKKRILSLKEISLTGADVNLVYYRNDSSLNLQFLLDHFASNSTDTTPSDPWKLECASVRLIRSHFAYRDERYMNPGKGIDFSDMDFAGLNLEVKDIQIHGDSIEGDIRQLTCKEKSGFRLDDFSTRAIVSSRGLSAQNLKITTGKSRLSLDLKFEYPNWNAFNEFIDSVRITAAIAPSQLDMRDIVSFAPDVDGMENLIDFSGNFRGTVASFVARDFRFTFGKLTSFAGTIAMNGLPDIEETFVNLKMDQFQTDLADVQGFTLPYSSGENHIPVPAEIGRFGKINISGRFTGFYNDFVSKATFGTDVGQITTDILLSNNKAKHEFDYNGRILISSLDAGRLLQRKELGTLSLYAAINGKNFSADKADLTLKSEITNLQYQGNTIGLINVDGEFHRKKFSGGVYINDELLGLDFLGSADFSSDLPSFNFKADIERADLIKLKLLDGDSAVKLSTSTHFDFTGNSIDNLIGSLHFSNTCLELGGQTLSMENFSLSTTQLGAEGKRMEVKSDFADALFTGQYTFDDFSDYLTMVFTDFLPSLSKTANATPRAVQGTFDYSIQLHHTAALTRIFTPWLKINANTVISGTFNPLEGKVNVNGRSPLVIVSGFAFKDWSLNGSSLNRKLTVQMGADEVRMSGEENPDTTVKKIEQFRFDAEAANDSVTYALKWDDKASPDHFMGHIKGSLLFSELPRLTLHIDDALVMINDTVFTGIPGSRLVFDSTFIDVSNLGLMNKDRFVRVDGIVSEDPLSQLIVSVQNFNISQTDILTSELGFDLDGFLDGKLTLSELYAVPRISADLSVKELGFNHENLGDALIKSYWDDTRSLIAVDMRVAYVGNAGTHYPIKVIGDIYPERKHDNFDLNIDVDNLKVRTIEPFLEGIFSRIKGYTSGALTLTGDFADPVLKGKLNLMRTEMMVDYLKTTYSFTGDFNFDKDKMWFNGIELRDTTFGKGVASGVISHHAFADWALDINLKADNLIALNTAYNPVEIYYGKAKASGTLTLTGPVDNLVIRANMKSEKGTDVFIPISFSRNISENEFIRYRQHGDSTANRKASIPEESSVLSLNLGLDVTRNADIGIILPYQMGTIDVRGDGLINMGIDSRGEYSMFGQYMMDNGIFAFNFENILKKNFQIQKGGTITFNGSPFEADIFLQAIYKVKTTLAGLPEIPEEYRSTRINVNCIINLSENLYNPNIKFGIALPDASEEVKKRVFSIIDTTNALEMNQQMIALLVLNTFSSTSGISSSSASLGISSYEILSAQLSRMLSQISKDFDIGVNYRPGDQLSPQELELALSTQLFNNRVTIDGAFGMNTYNDAARTTQVIGDVLVEAKITEDGRFRVKAFNRTNSSMDLYSGYSPYTQGVGILFRKEFNSLVELFKRKKKMLSLETPESKTEVNP